MSEAGEILRLCCYGLEDHQCRCLEKIIRPDVTLKIIPECSLECEATDILIIPTQAVVQQLSLELIQQNPSILCWDKLENYLLEVSWSAYCNAEQYYLRYAIEKACASETDTLLLGSSYAKYGLSTSIMGNSCVNLGLDAQDIFYTCRLGMKVIEKKPQPLPYRVG